MYSARPLRQYAAAGVAPAAFSARSAGPTSHAASEGGQRRRPVQLHFRQKAIHRPPRPDHTEHRFTVALPTLKVFGSTGWRFSACSTTVKRVSMATPPEECLLPALIHPGRHAVNFGSAWVLPSTACFSRAFRVPSISTPATAGDNPLSSVTAWPPCPPRRTGARERGFHGGCPRLRCERRGPGRRQASFIWRSMLHRRVIIDTPTYGGPFFWDAPRHPSGGQGPSAVALYPWLGGHAMPGYAHQHPAVPAREWGPPPSARPLAGMPGDGRVGPMSAPGRGPPALGRAGQCRSRVTDSSWQ